MGIWNIALERLRSQILILDCDSNLVILLKIIEILASFFRFVCQYSHFKMESLIVPTLLFSHSVVADYLWCHALQHAKFPCPSLSPRACSNSCPLSRWCHPTILSSVTPFSFLQSFSASGFFPMSFLFTLDASTWASVLPVNIQGWYLLELTVLFPCCPRDSQESSSAPQFENINSLMLSLLHGSTLISTWLLEEQ